MIRTQVSFDIDTYRAAQAEARREGISFAELCRRAIARILAERQAQRKGNGSQTPWMRLAGALSSGDPDASRTVDAVVYGRPEP